MPDNGRMILRGDCLDIMREMPDASVDAIVTDPPYGLSKQPDMAEVLRHWLAGDDYKHKGGGFMGKSWDSFVPGPSVWRECLRVLKPGGHLVAFFAPRTYHLGAVAVALAGFEIRDMIEWLFGTGFPKSLDVSKAIDKMAGAERKVVGASANARASRSDKYGGGAGFGVASQVTAPATPDAEQWNGWGTALKPAQEPIVLARKPLDRANKTVAKNVLAHGTGALNVDGCRIGGEARYNAPAGNKPGTHAYHMGVRGMPQDAEGREVAGRWPANVILDETAAEMLDEQSGTSTSRRAPRGKGLGYHGGDGVDTTGRGHNDSGGASRFFYTAKTSPREREAGLTDQNMLCQCSESELLQWLEQDRNRSTDSEKDRSVTKATTESDEAVDTSWPTDGSGSSTTDPSQTDTTSTTSTKTSSTTESKTSSSSTRSRISESIADASSSTESGSSRARSASKESRLEKSIGISAARAGRVTEDVGRATSRSSSEISGLAVCERCNRWCSKPGASEATGGRADGSDGLKSPRAGSGRTSGGRFNVHSTVKPIALMRWLVRLITPPGGIVLDPFCGSGSTGCAAAFEGFEFIGIEREEEYAGIAEARIAHWKGQADAAE